MKYAEKFEIAVTFVKNVKDYFLVKFFRLWRQNNRAENGLYMEVVPLFSDLNRQPAAESWYYN